MLSKLLSLCALVAAAAAGGHEGASQNADIMLCLGMKCEAELGACVADMTCSADLQTAMAGEEEPTPEEVAKWTTDGQTLFACYASNCAVDDDHGDDDNSGTAHAHHDHGDDDEMPSADDVAYMRSACELQSSIEDAITGDGSLADVMGNLGDAMEGVDLSDLGGADIDLSDLGNTLEDAFGDLENALGDLGDLGDMSDFENALGDASAVCKDACDLSAAMGSDFVAQCKAACGRRVRARRGGHEGGHDEDMCAMLVEMMAGLAPLCARRVRRDAHIALCEQQCDLGAAMGSDFVAQCKASCNAVGDLVGNVGDLVGDVGDIVGDIGADIDTAISQGVDIITSSGFWSESEGHDGHDGDDDDGEMMECMAQHCSTEQNACEADNTCKSEFEAAHASDEMPSPDGKSAKFGKLLKCFISGCMPKVDSAVCDAMADIASSPPAGLETAAANAGVDLSDVAENTGGGADDEDSAISAVAQLTTVAVAAAVALVW